MMRRVWLAAAMVAMCGGVVRAQDAPPVPPPTVATLPPDGLKPLDFLVGTWNAVAKAPGGAAGANVVGTYTFRRDVGGHALVRTSSADTCSGPKDFDCAHNDMFTAFADPNGAGQHGGTIFAFYLDNEGHVIYYGASLPDPHTVVFLSQGPATLPKARLTYHLEGEGAKAVMSGKFEVALPGSTEFHAYLEWSGTRVK